MKKVIVLLLIVLPIKLVSQSCNSNSLYDAIVSAYHQSVAQKSDGSWSGWGALMSNSGGSVLSPQDINSTNYPNLTGIPLLASTASAGSGSSEQSVLLTTTGLFAWGTEGVSIPNAITTSATFQKLTINSKTDGLPTGVVPTDVVSLVAINNAVIIVTSSGSAYVIIASTNNSSSKYSGDGSTTVNQIWHQVKINASTNSIKYTPDGVSAGTDLFTFAAIDDDGAEDLTPANFTINIYNPNVPSLNNSSSFSNFVACSGNISSVQTFTVSGTNLTNNVVVTAPTGFEVSLNNATGFGSTATITASGTLTATNIYVRMAASAIGNPTGNITVVSNGTLDQTISVSGNVSAAPIAGTLSGTEAICVGSTTTFVANNSSALDFDGVNDFATAPSGVYFDDNTFTIESWVYITAHNFYQRLFDFGNGITNNNVLFVLSEATNGKPGFNIYNASGQGHFINSPTPLPLNQWVHLAAVRNGTFAGIYVDGTLVVSSNDWTVSTPNATRNNCYIGKDNWGSNVTMGAKIGEFRIWSTARTQAQIQADMNSQVSAQADLRLLYRFDQGAANQTNTGTTTITDQSGANYNNGAPTNATMYNFALTGNTSNWTHGRNISQISGVWSSSDTTVATVDTNGLITGIAAGTATITFTVTGSGGCTATATRTVTVTAAPFAGNLSGNQTVCVGNTTTFTASTAGGNWSSSNTAIATVNTSGVITGVATGSTTITYTVTGTGGCANATVTRQVTVRALPPIIITENNPSVCTGGTITLHAVSSAASQIYGSGYGTNPSVQTAVDQNWQVVALPQTFSNSATFSAMNVTLPYPAKVISEAVLPSIFAHRDGFNDGTNTYYWIAPYANASSLQGGSYNWIVRQEFQVNSAGTYNFSFTGAGDNDISFFVDGTVNTSSPELPTISGGTQIGNTHTTFISTGTMTGSVYLSAGTHYAYMVMQDYGGLTCALISGANISSQNTYSWASQTASQNVFTPIANSNTATYTTPAVLENTTFQVTVSDGMCTDTAQVTVSANILPNSPVVPTGQLFCPGNTVANLQANTITGNTIEWYAATTGGSALSASTVLTEGAIYYAQSVNANGCASIRTPLTVVFNNALNFDATNDYVNVGDILENLSDVTMEAWVYWRGSSLSHSEIFTKDLISALAITSANKLHSNFGNGTSWIGGLDSQTSIPLNKWTHVAVTRQGGVVKMYINGVLDIATTTNSATGQNASPRLIGGKMYGGSSTSNTLFNGIIDEIRFWSVAKTAIQISSNLTTQFLGNEANLMAYYNFNQGIQNGDNTTILTLNNLVNSANNGVNTNFTLNGTTSNFVAGYFPEVSGTDSIFVGATTQLTHPVIGGTWSSGSTSVATVDSSGLVTAVSGGTSVITYSNCGLSASYTITVIANLVPTISAIANPALICPNTPSNAIGFTVNDENTPLSNLVLTATSSNTILVPNANIVFSGTGSTRSLVVTPATNQSGSATITLTVTDSYNTTATSSFVITFGDTVLPAVFTQNIIVNLNAAGVATITAAQINNGSTDNCGIATLTANPTNFTCANMGVNSVTLTVTDVNGNVATGIATVTIQDNTPPVVVCNPWTINYNGNDGTYHLLPDYMVTATDNCSVATIEIARDENNDGIADGVWSDRVLYDCSDIGTKRYIVRATDTSGNSSTCSNTVTINESNLPTVTTQNISINLNISGVASITASQVNNGSADDCSIATITVSPTNFNCDNIGTNTVTLTVTDVNGNVSTGTAIVTVVNTFPDTDGDGLANNCDADDDNDGTSDIQEQTDGTDSLNTCSYSNVPTNLNPAWSYWSALDCDNDGLTNAQEVTAGTNPLNLDTDGDGVIDGTEVADGTSPLNPCQFVLANQTVSTNTAWNTLDCDNDGLTNAQEVTAGTNPLNLDTDGDGVIDGTEVADGTSPLNPCQFVLANQTVSTNTAWNTLDCDNDGLTNGEEIAIGTNPLNADSDGDGVLDGTEIDDNTDPTNPCEANMLNATLPLSQEFLEGDCDGDGLTNGEEIGPNPNEPFDPNGNGIPDYLEVNNHTPSDDDLEIFNLVTPNGDGDNDVFVIRNIERYPENSLEVYNRWGVKVFGVEGYGQNGKFFRGISEGRATISQTSELPVGTYWYILKYKNTQGVWIQRIGYLYLNK